MIDDNRGIATVSCGFTGKFKFLNYNLELFIFIYMDIGGPSGRGRSRK